MKSVRFGLSAPALSALVLSALAVFNAAPAQAYTWGYSPYSGSANWQWIARSFGYPLNRLSTAGTPLYLLNPLIYNTAYAVGGANANRRQQAWQQQINQQAQGGAFYYPNYGQGQNRKFLGAYPTDQIAYQGQNSWASQPTTFPVNPTNPDGTPATGDPFDWQGPAPIGDSDQQFANGPIAAAPQVVPASTAGPMPANSDKLPPVAPQYAGSDSGSSAANSPFAGAFIHLVRTKYKGNIARALKDKQARSLARTLGVITENNFDPDEIPVDRLALIERVLADDKESAATRLTTVHMLLKH